MSMMNIGAAGAGDAGKGAGSGADDAENKNGQGAAGAGDAGKGDAGAGDTGKGAGEAKHDGEFDVNAIGEDLKNGDVYKNGLFFGKYKTLGEAAKGLKEITGQVRNAEKAPDEYDFSKLKVEGHDGLTVDKEDPIAKALLPVMKELNLPQATVEKLAAAYLPAFMGTQIDPKKEMEALGKDGDAMIKNFNEATANAPKEIKDALDRLDFTADQLRVLNWALAGKVEAAIPARTTTTPTESAAALKDKAFAYKTQHAKTIESNEEQQKEYQNLMDAWARADDAEKSKK
jgi:hypothetical protein